VHRLTIGASSSDLNRRDGSSCPLVEIAGFSGQSNLAIEYLAFIRLQMGMSDLVHIPTWPSSVVIVGCLGFGMLRKKVLAQGN